MATGRPRAWVADGGVVGQVGNLPYRVFAAIRRARFAWLFIAAAILAGCAAAPAPPPTTPTPPPPTPAPFDACSLEQGGTLVPPALSEVQPAQPAPGDEITLIASGGYVQCGTAYNESARDFLLYLDGNWVGVLSCYANRCEGTAQLPNDLAPGTHLIDVEGGGQFEVMVVGQ